MALDTTHIDPDGQYRVIFTAPIVMNDQVTLYPGWDVVLAGAAVIQHAEVIASAQAV